MRRGLFVAGMFLTMPLVYAGVPRQAPPISSPWLERFLSSFRAHHNVLERLTVDPDGVVRAMPGSHVEATFNSLSHICAATGSGPLTTTEWKCTSGQSLP